MRARHDSKGGAIFRPRGLGVVVPDAYGELKEACAGVGHRPDRSKLALDLLIVDAETDPVAALGERIQLAQWHAALRTAPAAGLARLRQLRSSGRCGLRVQWAREGVEYAAYGTTEDSDDHLGDHEGACHHFDEHDEEEKSHTKYHHDEEAENDGQRQDVVESDYRGEEPLLPDSYPVIQLEALRTKPGRAPPESAGLPAGRTVEWRAPLQRSRRVPLARTTCAPTGRAPK